MSIFSSIVDKIFHHRADAAPSQAQGAQGQTAAAQPAQAQAQAIPVAQKNGEAATSAKMQAIDVEAVLTKVASSRGGGGNWRTSVVDLLKLLDLDSSLTGRKELAEELNVRAGADGSAEQNIALQRAVMNKLAENGGKVPESMRT